MTSVYRWVNFEVCSSPKIRERGASGPGREALAKSETRMTTTEADGSSNRSLHLTKISLLRTRPSGKGYVCLGGYS